MLHRRTQDLEAQTEELRSIVGLRGDDKIIEAMKGLLQELGEDFSARISALQQTQEAMRREHNERAAAIVSMTQRLDMLSTQVGAVQAQQEAMRSDFPNLYIPRREYQAEGISTKVVALEAFRLAITKEMTELQAKLQEQIHSAVLDATKGLATVTVEAKDDMASNRKDLDARTVMLILTALNIAISAIMHFWH